MKRTLLVIGGLVAVSAFLLSAGSLVRPSSPSPFPEDELSIALRQAGHTVLLQAGDSVSRVLPVKKTDPHTFRLEFQSSFAFVPDSLVKAVKNSLSTVDSPLSYTVHVVSCASEDIVYGFRIGQQQQSTLVPCLGRAQPEGCYAIVVSFSTPAKATITEQRPYLLVLALASLAAATFIWSRFPRKETPSSEPEPETPPSPTPDVKGIALGQFTLYPDERILRIAQTTMELSDKEAHLLTVFASNFNQPVTREQLMKEVWQDDGALISRSLDVFISRLRKKLKDDPSLQLMNIHGMGYKLILREQSL